MQCVSRIRQRTAGPGSHASGQGQRSCSLSSQPSRRRRLSALYRWRRLGARTLTPAVRSSLARADALLTTWDSPRFDASLPEAAPGLRLVAHCGGEVKGRFARPLFDRLTITNAAAPMAPYVAELAVTFLLHAARNVDGYRESLRRPANDVYAQAHTRGAGDETVRGRTVGLVGFGRIGQHQRPVFERASFDGIPACGRDGKSATDFGE